MCSKKTNNKPGLCPTNGQLSGHCSQGRAENQLYSLSMCIQGPIKRDKEGAAVECLTLRRLMSYTYIYGAPILDVSRSHTTTQHSR